MATYYVAVTGNDRAAGTIDAPWKTLHISSQRLAVGDTLYLRGGVYSLPTDGEILISKANITLSAFGNEVPVIDGRAVFNTRPWPNTISSNPVGMTEYEPLIRVDATGVTLKGLYMRDSAGEGVRINAKNCIVDDCHVDTAYGAGISFMDGSSGIAKDCSVTKTGRKGTQAALRGRYISDDLTFLRCKVSHGGGEGLSSIQSDHITMRDCEIWDNNKTQIYLEGTRHSTVDGCLIYCTNEIETGGFSASEGIHIASELYPQGAWVCEDIEITNNLIVGCGPNLKMAGGLHRGTPVVDWGMRNLRVFHNTFVNARADAGVIIGNQSPADNNKNNTQSWFVNNIIVQEGSLPIAKSFAGTDFSKFVFSHNVWSKKPAPVDFYNSATDKLGNAGLSNPPAILKSPADMRQKDYELVQSSVAIDAATKAYNASSGVDVTVDHFGNTRDNKPDIGAHEFQKVTTQADFSASPLQGVSPLKVTFQDQSASSDPITNWLWDFGDGSISNQQNPTHIYKAGTFTVSLRAANSLGSHIVTKSNLITAEAITPDATPRVNEGLQALYRFDQRNGNSIYDVSGEGAPLDLVINDLSRVKWTNDGLTILQPTLIASNGPAEKINEACRTSNEVTIEVWCTPANKTQEGPARIVSLSQNVHSRNLTLGQGLWGSQPSDLFDIRLRTTERSANGMPSLSSPQGSAAVTKTHIVFARNRRGLVRLYIDGMVVAESNIPGDFSTWNPRFPLLLGNETTGEYPWLGQMFLVAIYDRFLSWEEVRQNQRAGTSSPAAQESSTILVSSFKRFVLLNREKNGVLAKEEDSTVAYGVQYPDDQCVVCTVNGTSSMLLYADINKVLSSYKKAHVQLQWLD